MKRDSSHRTLIFVLCACLLMLNEKASAEQSLKTTGNEIVVGIVAVSAAIVVTTILLVHHYHATSIQGCAATGPNGIELRNEGDQQAYQLSGMTNDVKPGNRVRVTGKKQKAKGPAAADHAFLVEKLAKDYGACKEPK